MADKVYDVAIIGGGIVGVATAYKIQMHKPEFKVLVLEKEDILADHQTGNNSGVIHSGIYYTPGSKKAKNCVEGRRELVSFAKEHNIPHDVCGKVIAATDEKELPFMDKILKHGAENGVEGIQRISADEVKEIEPYCNSIGGIHVACTGIIDYRASTRKMAEIVKEKNPESEILTSCEAEGFDKQDGIQLIKTNKSVYRAKKLVFCAGLQADRLARKDGVKLPERVVGFRGDYYELTEQAKHKVKHLIYPVPNPDFPFLGVHFTRMTDGEIECGPSAVFTFKREGYGKTDFSLRDTWEALSYGGTWKLFFGNIKFGLEEQIRAFSKRRFLKTLQRLIPDLQMEDIKPGRSGVRALLLNQQGDTRDDFRIEYTDDSIHVLNAPSPAATASLAIGEDVYQMAEKHFGW